MNPDSGGVAQANVKFFFMLDEGAITMYINSKGARKYQNILFGLFLTAVLLGCGGGGSSSSGAPPSPPAAPIGDLSGDWLIDDTSTSSDPQCNEVTQSTVTISQTGNVTDQFGNVFSGTISGNTISWSGSYPDGAGITTIQSLSATVAADCNSLDGNSTWSYTEPGFSCSGTSVFTGTRIDPIGCGAGAPNPFANLAGTWFGILEAPNGALSTISVTIDGSGNLTDNGTGRQATITQDSAQIFSFVYTDDGTEGGFIVDPSFTHAGFLDEDFNFGVVQKGASALPAYAQQDIAATWSGRSVELDAAFNITQDYTSTATVAAADGRLTGNDSTGTTFSGFFRADAVPDFGVWQWSLTNSAGGSGLAEAFMSVDKSFIATWACDTRDDPNVNIGFPVDCAFGVWTKQ